MANGGLEQLVSNSCTTADEKFVALALVAAATATVSGVGGAHVGGMNGAGVGGGDINPAAAVDPFLLSSAAAAITSQASLSLGCNSAINLNGSGNSSDSNMAGSSGAGTTHTIKNKNGRQKDISLEKRIWKWRRNGNREIDHKICSTTAEGESPTQSLPIPGGYHGRTSRNNFYCR